MSFTVITNGSIFLNNPLNLDNDIRKKYNMDYSDYIFLFIGNVSERKNQKQVVDAIELMRESERKIKVMFIGDGQFLDLQNYINKKNLKKYCKVIGPVKRNEIGKFYAIGNATILTSYSEGFGLSIIEGFSFGLPNLTFKDLGAVKDLYHPDAMLLVNKRSTEELKKAMLNMTKIYWNKEKILNYSKKFSIDKMSENYIDLYKSIINLNQ